MDRPSTGERQVPVHTDNELVQLGVRVPRSLHFALKSASLQQERVGTRPITQAEIVADAIRMWLGANGYDW